MENQRDVDLIPEVSVLTPTHNRHRYIPILLNQFQEQDFQGTIELVIHDSTSKYYPLPLSDPRVTYVHDPTLTNIGAKRNRLNLISKGRILVCMDDDDIYYPGYVSECVRALRESIQPSSSILARSASTIIYYLQDNIITSFSRENTNRCINSAMAYTRDFLKTHFYKDSDLCNEERVFTKNYSCKVANMNPDKLGIHVVHTQNTANKYRRLIETDFDLLDQSRLVDAHMTSPYLYWINLRNRKDRSRAFFKQIGNHVLEHRVNAIAKGHGVLFNPKMSSDTEIACFLSHMKAMRTYITHSRDKCTYAIICEDDLVISNEKLFYEQIFYYLSTAPKDWEILQLHRIIINANITHAPALSWSKWEPHMFSTAIYIVRHTTARRLVEQFPEELDLSSYGRVVADNTIYTNCVTYSADMPYFRTNHHSPSDINKRHYELQKKNNIVIKSSSSRQGYPFVD